MPKTEKEKIICKLLYNQRYRKYLLEEEDKIIEKHRFIIERIGLTIIKENELRKRLKEIES